MRQDGETLHAALIGVGMVAPTYIAALASSNANIALRGVLGSTPQSGETFRQRHCGGDDQIVAYRDLDSLIADKVVDFAIVATPPNKRREIITALADAGKPILMEKPVERTWQAAQEICDLCERASVPLGIVLQHRARPSAQALRDLVEGGSTGPLRSVEINFPWWREQAYYDAPGRGTYGRDGGGVLISQAIHTLDLALQFTPAVRSITSMVATTEDHAMEAENFVSAGLQFDDGAVGSLYASTAAYPGTPERIVLHYANVTARLEASELALAWRDGREETIGSRGSTGAGADPMAFTADWHQAVIENFADHIRLEAPLIASGRSALAVHSLIEAIIQSGQEGRTISLTEQKGG